ncbi:MAG: MiaB/RimO family radical SAM methylthiotransferase [Rickettsiales bacterium]|nr:MiaB/RimO family radical SAM methylthiotransferase [Rickettsiales bacterium]
MENIKIVPFGCRLNTLESEKIRNMLYDAGMRNAIVVNTCAVTAEAERQSRQAIRKLSRENPGVPLYITGCAATRAPENYSKIKGVAAVVSNKDKLDMHAYGVKPSKEKFSSLFLFPPSLSKGFVQIQNGCNHNCAYCIVSRLRGKNVSFPYEKILSDVRALVANGYHEIVLTGVDIAGYRGDTGGVREPRLSDLCRGLLRDVPDLRRLRLSSLDPGTDLRPISDLMREDSRMLPHMHLSMQSGSDTILAKMARRHNARMVRELMNYAKEISFSWDLICGFPGETPELFNETCDLIKELGPIRLHAFPFSPRPGTPAATMPDQIDRAESKRRLNIATDIARENMRAFMVSQYGKTVQVLVEENNIARDAHDIPVIISGAKIPARTIANVEITGIRKEKEFCFAGNMQTCASPSQKQSSNSV